MDIQFKTNKLKKSVATLLAIKENYGTMAKSVNIRLNELRHVTCLEEMRSIPQANCHELFHNWDDHLSVDVSKNHRIIFKPDNNPIPLKEDGGLDWSLVTKIKIMEIAIDYH